MIPLCAEANGNFQVFSQNPFTEPPVVFQKPPWIFSAVCSCIALAPGQLPAYAINLYALLRFDPWTNYYAVYLTSNRLSFQYFYHRQLVPFSLFEPPQTNGERFVAPCSTKKYGLESLSHKGLRLSLNPKGECGQKGNI